jgi:hypothetical protein
MYRTIPTGAGGWSFVASHFAHCETKIMRLAAALLTLVLSAPSAVADDLPFARVYHLVADICINEMLANKDALSHLMMAGRSVVVHCDCVAQTAGGHFAQEEYASVRHGEIPASARAMWLHWHDVCLNAGH